MPLPLSCDFSHQARKVGNWRESPLRLDIGIDFMARHGDSGDGSLLDSAPGLRGNSLAGQSLDDLAREAAASQSFHAEEPLSILAHRGLEHLKRPRRNHLCRRWSKAILVAF